MHIETERKYSFDMLKLIAIAIIVLHHYQQLTQIHFNEGINWYGGNFYWGNLVELFFIISGYFTYKSVKTIKSPTTFSSFFLRKYFRFLPMLIICGLACLLVQWGYGEIDSEHTASYTLWNVFSSLLGFERWIDEARMVNNPMWYVSVLLLCLILFFFVSDIARKAHFSLYLVYGIMMAVGLTMRAVCLEYDVSLPFMNLSIGRGIFCFFLGLLIAHTLSQPSIASIIHDKKVGFLIAIIIVIGFVVLFAIKSSFITSSSNGLYYTLCFVVYPALVVICESPIMREAFRVPILRNIGGIAYNMYAWHITLIYVCLIVFHIFGAPAQGAAAMYAFLLICFLFSTASHKFIDKPLSRYISRKRAEMDNQSESN